LLQEYDAIISTEISFFDLSPSPLPSNITSRIQVLTENLTSIIKKIEAEEDRLSRLNNN
jgi:hypothetical protein